MSANEAAGSQSSGKSYTLEEVAKHNKRDDCWIVVHGKVLDVTPFLSEHPGGEEIILQDGGKDLTTEFEDTGHSKDARRQLDKYVIGHLETTPKPKATSSGDGQKYYTPEEVAKHNKEDDCWIVIHGKVLDITPFLTQHPGGDDIILQDAGADLTAEFEDTGHSSDARKQLDKYVIGLLEGASESASKQKKAKVAAASSQVNPAVILAVFIAILASLYLLLNP